MEVQKRLNTAVNKFRFQNKLLKKNLCTILKSREQKINWMEWNFVFQERLTRMTVVFFNGRFQKQLTQKLFWAVFVFLPYFEARFCPTTTTASNSFIFQVLFVSKFFYLPQNFSRAVSHCRASQVGGTTIQRRRRQTALSWRTTLTSHAFEVRSWMSKRVHRRRRKRVGDGRRERNRETNFYSKRYKSWISRDRFRLTLAELFSYLGFSK